MTRRTFETLVGAAVVVVAAVALVIAFTGERLSGLPGYLVYAHYDQADGLKPGGAVLIGGLKIGEVEVLRLERTTNKAVVVMRIQSEIGIPADSAALILSDGLLGDKYIKIEPGSDDETMKDGDRFDLVQDAVIVEQLLERIVRDAEVRRAASEKSPN